MAGTILTVSRIFGIRLSVCCENIMAFQEKTFSCSSKNVNLDSTTARQNSNLKPCKNGQKLNLIYDSPKILIWETPPLIMRESDYLDHTRIISSGTLPASEVAAALEEQKPKILDLEGFLGNLMMYAGTDPQIAESNVSKLFERYQPM